MTSRICFSEVSLPGLCAQQERLPLRHPIIFFKLCIGELKYRISRDLSTGARQKKRRLDRSADLVVAAPPEVQEILEDVTTQVPDDYPEGHRAGGCLDQGVKPFCCVMPPVVAPRAAMRCTCRICGDYWQAKCREKHVA